MASIGDIAGITALGITLLWWFGITPQRIATWTKQHKIWGKINIVIPIGGAAFGIFDAAYHFIADPYGLGSDRWSYGGVWIMYSLSMLTFIAERYIKRNTTGYKLLIIGRNLFLLTACVLISIVSIGLNMPTKVLLIGLGIWAGVTLVLLATTILLRRHRRRKTN